MRLPGLLTLALTLAAGACGAAPSAALKFDLDCHGTATRNGRSAPFDLMMHVDLTKNQFCLGGCALAVTFTSVTTQQLVERYDIAASRGAPYGRLNPMAKDASIYMSTAAPSQQTDDLVIDRASGALRRDETYDQGDPASQRYVEHYVGVCREAAYGGP